MFSSTNTDDCFTDFSAKNYDDLAPIVLFVYNRLNETVKTLEALKQNVLSDKSQLFIFSDGPIDKADERLVNEVREYIHAASGFKSIEIYETDSNRGLVTSITSGISQVLKDFEKVIVLEDDLCTSPYFLQYMNDGLKCYQKHINVASISGFSVPIKNNLSEFYFLPGTFWWGWGTWRDRWELFNKDGKYLLNELRERKAMKDYNINGSFLISPEITLRKHLNGTLQSWAVRWHASMLLENKYSLYSSQSLVNNIGIGNGTNCRIKTSVYNSKLVNKPLKVDFQPVKTQAAIVKKIKLFYLKAHLILLLNFIKQRILFRLQFRSKKI